MTARIPAHLTRHVRVSSKVPPNVVRETLTRPWVALRVFQQDNYAGRLPDHYKKFYWEWKKVPQTPVHYILETRNFERLPTGEVIQKQDQPLHVLQPKELHQGLWGGEAVVKGFTKKHWDVRRSPRYWVPTLQSTVLYSEILDKYMSIVVTKRTLRLVDEHFGLDYYILKTPPSDLMSNLAVKLKREMYLALAKGTLYPDNPEKKKEVFEKYKEYMIPLEEAEWYGLTIKEAATKQKILEEDHPPQPLKLAFRKEFLEYLKDNKDNLEKLEKKLEPKSLSTSDWMASMNPFAKK